MTRKTEASAQHGPTRGDRLGLIIIAMCVLGSLAACGAWLAEELAAKTAWSDAGLHGHIEGGPL
jgi:hypothetical protein